MSVEQYQQFIDNIDSQHYKVNDVAQHDFQTLQAGMPISKAFDKFCKKQLKKTVKQIADLQQRLYAEKKHAVLCVFQAIDAAGKDSTIRNVSTGINPAGFAVHSFAKPSDEEYLHDYLWRCNRRLPQKGKIGIFNRSYYEEVLVVKVHPNFLKPQGIDYQAENLQSFWQQRYESINHYEKHLYHNNTIVVKFWLNVSKDEQKRRFMSRLTTAEKYWKFSANDLKERALWDDYQQAFRDMLQHTSSDYAPWYAIPADNKAFMRLQVANIILQRIQQLNPQYPQIDDEQSSLFDDYISQLQKM